MRGRNNTARHRGFTLMEIMVVVAVVLVLVSIAIPAYNRIIIHAREAVLRQNLFALRSIINQYAEDLAKAPQSLTDLVSAGYLKQIPVDPFTNSDSSWRVQHDADVHSGSDKVSTDGTTYREW